VIFFALKTPTASAGFESTNSSTRGQHATSRQPKPLLTYIDSRLKLHRKHVAYLFFSYGNFIALFVKYWLNVGLVMTSQGRNM
jgi:hypothetical protein